MNKRLKNKKINQGITLIALVITIIVMLILVGVTVTVALNGGLFSTAKDAVKNTEIERQKEERLSKGRINVDGVWYNSLEDYAKGIASKEGDWKLSDDGSTVINGDTVLKVGDYVNYEYDINDTVYTLKKEESGNSNDTQLSQSQTLKWRILGADANGCLTLISNEPVEQHFYFKGATGYNNGVYILNEICRTFYSNKELGITARSINIDDIYGVKVGDTLVGGGMNVDARENYTSSGSTKYQNTKTYENRNNKFPEMYARENGSGIGVSAENADTGVKTDGIGQSNSYYTELTRSELENKSTEAQIGEINGDLTCTQTYFNIPVSQTDCKNKIFYSMVFGCANPYWLATRYVDCRSDRAFFGLYDLAASTFRENTMYASNGDSATDWDCLRPVISIGFDIKVIPYTDGETSATDTEKMHTLTKADENYS